MIKLASPLRRPNVDLATKSLLDACNDPFSAAAAPELRCGTIDAHIDHSSTPSSFDDQGNPIFRAEMIFSIPFNPTTSLDS
jgi:hypothetical protein